MANELNREEALRLAREHYHNCDLPECVYCEKLADLLQRVAKLAAAKARVEEAQTVAAVVKEYDDLDEHTPCDEGHREFHKKYGEVDILPVIQKRIAQLQRELKEAEDQHEK